MTGAIAGVARWAGPASAVALAVSGAAIALQPEQAAAALGLAPTSRRGIAELRAGVGGTFAALGLWAAIRGSADAYRAVGFTWLGAAALRTLSLVVDDPETDGSYWLYLVGEVSLGIAGATARARAVGVERTCS